MNAQIGKEAVYSPTIGREALHQESNENGKRLIHFAASRSMVIGTALFQHKDIHKITWRTPDGHSFSQTDHLLIDLRHSSHLMNVRSHRCTNVDSDNFHIVSLMQARISTAEKVHGKKAEKYDYGKMMIPEKQEEYKINLTEHLQELDVNYGDNLDSRWNKIICTIHKTAKEVFGKMSRKQLKDWFDKEYQEATEEKNEAYVYMQQQNYTRASTDKYIKHDGKKSKYIRG